jgi:chemotaxis protein methyltransferase CheR
VVGLSDAFKPYPERRGLYRPNAARAPRGGAAMPLRAVASAAR